ncbi:MAG: dockerin type I repeat-containing protein, partial [Candidatus Zixiibacteriota bacterium]
DSSGTQVWLRQYDGAPGGEADEAKAIAVSGSGHVYGTGESNSTVAPSFDYDYATIKYFQGEVRGDANSDGVINVSDVIYLINYLFRAGDPPEPVEAGDVNCDETTDLADVLYLVNYLYRDGPLPCGM